MKAKIMKIIHSIFKTFVLSLLMIAQVHFAYAQNAAILPPAKTTFVDQNGKPLTAGTVDFYIPGTTTRKTTWQDAAATIPNTNPVVLDSAGRALILGNGAYRQIVKDRNSNIIWDQVTNSAGAGGGSTTTVGDGNAVGTVLPWSGFVVPINYAFAYGQELSRTTYSVLLAAITLTQNITCVSGNATLTNVSDTTQLNIGAAVEAACVPAGSAIISKTANTVTISANATVSVTTSAIFYPWGNGNGLTTFNVPDLRGVVLPGRNNMGGASSLNLNSSFYTDPDALGGSGGSQSKTILTSNLPSYTPSGSITSNVSPNSPIFSTGAGGSPFSGSAGAAYGTLPQILSFNGNSSGGGIAASATVAAGGSGYTAGTQLLTVSGGTCTTQPQFNVTISAGAITAPVLVTAGSCTIAPSNPAATTGGGGTGGTLNVIYSALPFSLIQPSKTINYVIKTLPDVNASSSVNIAVGSTTISSGTNTRILYNNNGVLGEYSNIPVSLGGTGGSSASGTLLDNITGFSGTGFLTRTGAGAYAFQSTTNGIVNSNLAQMGAFAFKGNNTSGTANAADVTISGLTTKASPAAGDFVMLSDQAASGAWKKATVSSLASAGSVSSINGQTGAITLGTITPQVRVTLASATPVMVSNQASATTVYVTPYRGCLVPIYDGTNMVPTCFAEVSQTTADTTKSPAAVTTSSIYDIFCWIDTGPTNRCTRGPAWTNDTTRSAGTALVLVNGIWLNNASITNGPAAQRGTYVGSIRSDGSSTINYIFGAVSASCTAGNFAVYNAYNRVNTATLVGTSADSWTYAVANTWRQINGNTACQVSTLRGLNEEPAIATYLAIGTPGAATNGVCGVGVNSNTAFSGTTGLIPPSTTANCTAKYSGYPGLGYYFISAIEFNSTATSSTWNGDSGTAYVQTGIHVEVKQ